MTDSPNDIIAHSLLLIDREKRSRATLQRVLSKMIARIDVADSILQASEAFGDFRYDFICIESHDSIIPASQAISYLKDKSRLTAAFFLLICKEFDVDRALALIQSGFDGVIGKPFTGDLLSQRLRLEQQRTKLTAQQTGTVLIADGNEKYRSMLADILAEHFNVVEAVNGFEAILCAVRSKPECIILSTTLDSISFEHVITELKRRDETHDSRIFLSLFDSSDEVRATLMQRGADATIRRSTDEKILRESLIAAGLLQSAHAGD